VNSILSTRAPALAPGRLCARGLAPFAPFFSVCHHHSKFSKKNPHPFFERLQFVYKRKKPPDFSGGSYVHRQALEGRSKP
jgi:hypothetical protein